MKLMRVRIQYRHYRLFQLELNDTIFQSLNSVFAIYGEDH
jgi:hypothetical protein